MVHMLTQQMGEVVNLVHQQLNLTMGRITDALHPPSENPPPQGGNVGPQVYPFDIPAQYVAPPPQNLVQEPVNVDHGFGKNGGNVHSVNRNENADRMLKYEDKNNPTMKIVSDPLQGGNTNFVEPVDICMMELVGEFAAKLIVDPTNPGVEELVEDIDKKMIVDPTNIGMEKLNIYPAHVCMVKLAEAVDRKMVDPVGEEEAQDLEGVYPNAGETLVKFLSRSQEGDKEVMLCPICSVVFDKAAAKLYQDSEMKRNFQQRVPVSRRLVYPEENSFLGQKPETMQSPQGRWVRKDKAYVPHAGAPQYKWVRPKYQKPLPKHK